MKQPNEKYLRGYAYEFKDREVRNPMTYDMTVNSTSDGKQNVTLVPTPGQVIEQGTPYSKAVMQQGLQGAMLDLIYPVGRGFIDFSDYDYSNYLGFQWERTLLGMFPLGGDDVNYKLGDAGGSKTKTTSSTTVTVESNPNSNVSVNTDFANSRTDVSSNSHSHTTKTHNHTVDAMPPYAVVNYWKRIG